jgi:hypothetical protein
METSDFAGNGQTMRQPISRARAFARLAAVCLLAIILSACSRPDLASMFGPATVIATEAASAAPTAESSVASSAASAAAGAAIEAYFRALVAKNRSQYTSLICADWQANAAVEFDSFGAVTTTLQGLSCAKATVQGDTAQVMCKGKIVVNYNGRLRDLTLDKRTYHAKLENGTWKMCGYQ